MSSVTGKANGKTYSVLQTPTQIRFQTGRYAALAESGVSEFRIYLGCFPELSGRTISPAKRSIEMYFLGRLSGGTWEGSKKATVEVQIFWIRDVLMMSFSNPGNLITHGFIVLNEDLTITLG